MICLPDSNVRVLDVPSRLHYFDTQSLECSDPVTALEAWNTMTSDAPLLLRAAFRVRDFVSSMFGVKRIGGFSGDRVDYVQVGEYLDFFLVEYVDQTCLVLTERDRHLDVMTCLTLAQGRVTVTSSVQVHNLFGRLYMIPVGLAHPWIVRWSLGRLHRAGGG